MKSLFTGIYSVVVTVAILFLFSAETSRAVETVGNIAVSPLSFSLESVSHGYIEHRVKLSNMSSARSYGVTLHCPKVNYSGGERIDRISRSIVLGPSATAIVSLPQPPLRMSGDSMVVVDVHQGPLGKFSLASLSQNHNAFQQHNVSILVSRSINRDDLANAIIPAVKKKPGRGYSSSSSPQNRWRLMRSELEITDWSDSWLGYSCFDGIVIGRDDVRDMPSAVLLALRQYVESGGTLLVAGEIVIPDAWRRSDIRTPQGMTSYFGGFGQCILYDQSDFKNIPSANAAFLKQSWDWSLQPWQQNNNVASAHKMFPVVENIRVPVRGMFIIMLIFALLIGPINIFVLAYKKRKIWLLWTAPLISLVTCVIISVYSLFAEGITPTVRMQSFTVLDEATRRATTLGLAGYYCPLTPAGGLHFDYNTEITPLVARNSYGSGSSRRLDWTKDQHLSVGWLTARVPAYFMLRKSEPRRERIEIRHNDDKTISAVNGLGAKVSRLWVADASGTIYKATDIPAGASVILEADNSGERAEGKPNRMRSTYIAKNWATSTLALTNNVSEVLWPQTYLAVLDDTAFIEPGISGKTKKTTPTANNTPKIL